MCGAPGCARGPHQGSPGSERLARRQFMPPGHVLAVPRDLRDLRDFVRGILGVRGRRVYASGAWIAVVRDAAGRAIIGAS